MKKITSSDNSTYKKFIELKRSTGIKDHGLCLVEGAFIVREFYQTFAHLIECLIWSPDCLEFAPSWADNAQVDHFLLTPSLFQKVSSHHLNAPLLVARVPQTANLQSSNDEIHTRGLSAILPLKDPKNLGAALRSLKGFDIHQALLTQTTSHPFLPEVTKVAAGANFLMDIQKIETSSITLPTETTLYALDGSGVSLYDLKLSRNCVLWVGEEGRGLTDLPPHLTPQLIKIPTHPALESLNATVALSIFCYEYRRKYPLPIKAEE